MPIGQIFPTEWKSFVDSETGRTVRQLTAAKANSYPLYYFIPSITPDNRYLVLHSERSGWVQLYRLDLNSGDITQLTDGRTRDSGWAIWCEHRLRGIYNHLSALNGVKYDVYYFQDNEICCTHIETLENRPVYEMPGRIPIGQSGFSPDGRHFAFIHADSAMFKRAIADREAILNMRQPFDGQAWRDQVPCTIGVLDTESGVYRDVIPVDFHVHHVFFLDDDRLLVNHVRGENGMWTVNLDGTGVRHLRPRSGNAPGAVCHQLNTERGVLYEANDWRDGERTVWFGRYDLDDDSFQEVQLPADVDYVHTGYDSAGRFLCIENQSRERHELLAVMNPQDPERLELKLLRTLGTVARGQRYHAHPFLGPDRQWLFFTDVIEGFSQVCAMDIRDLVDLDVYWGPT